jgi:methylmalonyl-CoA mutase
MTERPPFLTHASPEIARWFDLPDAGAWRKAATAMLKGGDPDSLIRALPEGVTCEPLFVGPLTVDSGSPDAPPYVRGSRVADRRAAGWDVRARGEAGSLSQAGEAAAADLGRGARSLWIDPASAGVATLADLDALLASVDLAATPVHVEANASARPWLAALTALARARGVKSEALTGSIACDPAGTLARTGSLPGSVGDAYADLAAAIRDARHTPWVHLLACSGLPYADAGAHGVQELAIVLAAGAEALRRLGALGLTVAEVAPRVLVQLSVGTDTFVEIARLRALRGLWSRLIAACGGDDEAQRVFVHAVSARSVLTRRDPWVNTLRATGAGFSAAVGGADAVTLRTWDELLGLPDDSARRLSSTGQVVLEAEAHLSRVADPAGGSWYLETMTDRLARAAWEAFQKIEGQGGLIAALQSGWIDGWIAQARAERLAAVVAKRRPILGVSVHPNKAEELPARAPRVVASSTAEAATGATLDALIESLRAGRAIAPTTQGVTIVPLPLFTDEGAWDAGQEVAR